MSLISYSFPSLCTFFIPFLLISSDIFILHFQTLLIVFFASNLHSLLLLFIIIFPFILFLFSTLIFSFQCPPFLHAPLAPFLLSFIAFFIPVFLFSQQYFLFHIPSIFFSTFLHHINIFFHNNIFFLVSTIPADSSCSFIALLPCILSSSSF